MSLSFDIIYRRYKKMYDPMYTISVCKKDEIEDVLRFIDEYWRKGHAIVRSKELLDWQYFNKSTNTYNFVIARSKETGEIHAIEGFIPTTQFDNSIKDAMTWGAIWKSIPDVAPPGLGFVVKQYREDVFGTKYNCEIGVSSDAQKYNKQFGNTIFKLENWYLINKNISEFRLAEVNSITHKDKAVLNNGIGFRIINAEEWYTESKGLDIPEYKSATYYVNRYFNHPIYKYQALVLQNNETGQKEVIFFRVVSHLDSRCIFFVDYIGGGCILSKSSTIIRNLLNDYKAEYVLFPCYGVNEECLEKAGFVCTRNTSDIIPIYYEPFLKQNIEIVCASKASVVSWNLFKGDSDQDRPNIIQEMK